MELYNLIQRKKVIHYPSLKTVLMIEKIINEDLDLVVASRWIKGGGVNKKNYGIKKYILNRIFTFFIRVVYKGFVKYCIH